MKTNVEKVLERDQKLSELDDRAGEQNYVLHYLKIEWASNFEKCVKLVCPSFRRVAAGGLTV
jgi:hypothetical protein